RLRLQPDRLAGQLLELRDGAGFLVEQPLDDVGTCEDQELLKIELAMLADDLAKDLVADRLGRLHEPAPSAARTRLTQHVLEALAVALARHLDETERRDAHALRLRVIVREPRLERLQHLATMLLLGHVDEVDDDDAAEVAQPELSRDHDRGLEIGSEDRLLEVAMTDVRSGVDVD